MTQVLDLGFVNLIDSMGTDLSVVNAARVSFGKHKDEFDSTDSKLLKFLFEHEHTAPFRHCYMTFHIKAPIFVFRQWMKHRIASDFNELSGRYAECKDEFYVPEVFRKQATDNKQGSFGEIRLAATARSVYIYACKESMNCYHALIGAGLCREQARCILPLGLYSEAYWTVSLQAALHFLHLREDSHAQWEMQQYAHAIRQTVEELFPETMKAYMEFAK